MRPQLSSATRGRPASRGWPRSPSGCAVVLWLPPVSRFPDLSALSRINDLGTLIPLKRLEIMPSNQMTLRFTCPSSGQELDYPVAADFKSLAKRWTKPVNLHCPHCGFEHRFLFREGYPGGVLAGFGCAGAHTSITDLMSGSGGAENRAVGLSKPIVAKHALTRGPRSRRAPAP